MEVLNIQNFLKIFRVKNERQSFNYLFLYFGLSLRLICNKMNLSEEKISLAKKFDEYNGKNLAKDFSWDDAKGKEIWQ